MALLANAIRVAIIVNADPFRAGIAAAMGALTGVLIPGFFRYVRRAERDGWPKHDAFALAHTWPKGTHWLAPVPVWRGALQDGAQ